MGYLSGFPLLSLVIIGRVTILSSTQIETVTKKLEGRKGVTPILPSFALRMPEAGYKIGVTPFLQPTLLTNSSGGK